ncbi:MAG TPA: O-antigen ligase family protein [Actinomycetota bacterium]|nr:O-antigen ligase family protein [Actinomycetota bacterium]
MIAGRSFETLSSRLLDDDAGPAQQILLGIAVIALIAGIAGRAVGGIGGGVTALWAFTAATVALCLAVRLSTALVLPLYMGVLGWLVDMLPFVLLAGWTAVVVRWGIGLARARRLPWGGRWIWLPIGLVAWTALGVLVISKLDFKHFLLLLGIQVVSSATMLAVVDRIRDRDEIRRVVELLGGFILLLSVAVLLQWIGVPIEAFQDSTARRTVEEAYGVDAFPNNIGMIKYARSIEAGALELREEIKQLAAAEPELPSFEVFRPKFQAYENSLVVRFGFSARPFEPELASVGVSLLYDNVGLAPANTVPRLRSFPRNALTYAGICAAVVPLGFWLVWTNEGRRRRFGWAIVAACLFGAAFSLARGAWVAIALGAIYMLVVRTIDMRKRLQFLGAFIGAAIVITSVFLVKYGVDPLNGRAGGGDSVNTREDLYLDTLGSLEGVYLVLGYGTEKPRTESGTVKEGTAYVPRAGTHSTYLNYLFRTGLPGALAILALYGLALWHAHKGSRSVDGDRRLWLAACATSVAIAAAHAVILSLYVEPIYTLTISLIVGLVMASTLDLGASLRPSRRRSPGS